MRAQWELTMAPISKLSTAAAAATWTRKPSKAAEYRSMSSGVLNSDGNSSNYSSGEENFRLDGKKVPSFMLNDDLNGRSYVDPWDMENYSFLRRQLADVSLSDNDVSTTPAFESTQSDFYYVPLDNDGSPQYQYKHYVDSAAYRDSGISTPFTLRSDAYGLVANVDEHDFYNEHLDTPPHQSLQSGSGDSYPEFSNPSRQSERSRYNNQDYQTYMPPSIVKDGRRELFEANGFDYPRLGDCGGYYADDSPLGDFSPGYVDHIPRRRKNVEFELKENKRRSLADLKIILNRRKSFHELSSDVDSSCGGGKQERRRKSVLDHPQPEEYRPMYDIGVPDYRPKDNIPRRKSIHEIASDVTKLGKSFISQRIPRKSVLHSSENFEKASPSKDKAFADMHQGLPRPHLSPVPESSLAYVYETTKRRRKTLGPGSAPKHNAPQDDRYEYAAYEDGFSLDPMETYMNQPVSRYTMTNYGHLKIDYSCSWNCLDKYIAHRIRT